MQVVPGGWEGYVGGQEVHKPGLYSLRTMHGMPSLAQSQASRRSLFAKGRADSCGPIPGSCTYAATDFLWQGIRKQGVSDPAQPQLVRVSMGPEPPTFDVRAFPGIAYDSSPRSIL